MVILGLGGPPKKVRQSHDEDEDHELEVEGDYLDGEEQEYSDDQLEMAGELKSALMDGDEHDILTAIHGIMMSYR